MVDQRDLFRGQRSFWLMGETADRDQKQKSLSGKESDN